MSLALNNNLSMYPIGFEWNLEPIEVIVDPSNSDPIPSNETSNNTNQNSVLSLIKDRDEPFLFPSEKSNEPLSNIELVEIPLNEPSKNELEKPNELQKTETIKKTSPMTWKALVALIFSIIAILLTILAMILMSLGFASIIFLALSIISILCLLITLILILKS